MIRSIIFWTHLTCGIVAGIVVFTMSLTGVLLTYERQINNWVAESRYVQAPPNTVRMPLDDLIGLQQLAQPDQPATAVVITNDPGAPVTFRAGRRAGLNLNPYNGETMHMESPGLQSFFGAMTSFHRWFSIEGENRAVARQITGVSNVIFFFLVLSGMYLWLPAIWKWTMFKVRLAFRSSYPSSKIRDFHWHHIFGIWAAIPLLAVVYSGAVISYPWAANIMYMAFGAEMPAAGGGRGGPGGGQQRDAAVPVLGNSGDLVTARAFLPLDTLLAKAQTEAGTEWNRLTLTLPAEEQDEVQIEIDHGNGAQAFKRHTLSLDRTTGEVVNVQNFADTPEAQRLRGITRFLHTGEVLGFWGQTIAGLASLAALFMVWTGFALSWRRLIQPLFKKR